MICHWTAINLDHTIEINRGSMTSHVQTCETDFLWLNQVLLEVLCKWILTRVLHLLVCGLLHCDTTVHQRRISLYQIQATRNHNTYFSRIIIIILSYWLYSHYLKGQLIKFVFLGGKKHSDRWHWQCSGKSTYRDKVKNSPP